VLEPVTAAAPTSPAARLSGSARALALEIAAEARSEWGYASELIARAFRANRHLGSSDRRNVAETVYGLIRQDRRLDAIVDEMLRPASAGSGGSTDRALSPVARDELKLLVYELRSGLPPAAVKADVRRLATSAALDLGAPAAGGPPALDVERALGDDAGLGARVGIEREAVRLSYPTWLLERLTTDRGLPAALALAEAMNRRAPMAIRVNSARTSPPALIAALGEENVSARAGALAPSALVLETRVNAFALSAFKDGLFEVMDEGSQLVAELVAPPPGGRVLDACAGAGGKTLALGAALGGKGRVLALDVDGKKLEELRRRSRRAGLTNVSARQVTGGALPSEARPAGWDRVLVDAPCSGLGTLRRNPEARWRLTPAEVAGFPARQIALLTTYAPLVAVGGRLIYATCSVLAEENEAVVARFLAERDDFVVMSVKEIWGRARAEALGVAAGDGSLRLDPQHHDTDGFFAAVLRRVR
jgi:16S rRNA (cytosine967-C5)-methyltransferase